jgi:DNA/RNA-binding domain of Phe-tRNA-synthetase-like protein
MGSSDAALRPADGFVQAEVAAEFPGLRLQWATLAARRRPSPPAVVRMLGQVANRYRGASVVAMRTKPIPQAYRSFFRATGLDPDVQRIPSERVALERLVHGEFRSVNLVADAALIALIETGVPVWALDARHVDVDSLGIRVAMAGDRLGSALDGMGLPAGQLVVADREKVHATLFEDPAPEHAPGPRTQRMVLFAVAVDGVPAIHVEEALWVSTDAIEAG